jgi:UDP-2,3-diacylglucosamine pyrophosphatase LpxH
LPRRYLVISDLHLADVEDHRDGWKYYKARRFVADSDIRALIEKFVSESPSESEQTLILNGDVFDFDLISPSKEKTDFKVSAFERRWGLRPTAEKSVWKLRKILKDHEAFLDGLIDFLAAGGKIVYVLGNHDRELHFSAVQKAFLAALKQRGTARKVAVDESNIQFEPWFYFVRGEIYAEHGQQYDFYTSYRHVLYPTIPGRHGEELALPMGNISNRYLMSRMGYFNPHATDYILNIFSYVSHWLRYYAFSRRSLAISWFVGSLIVMRRLLRTKRKRLRRPPSYDALIASQARKYNLSRDKVEHLHRLRRPPITNQFFKIIREFWIDRLALTVLMIGGTVALALVPIPLWIKLMVPLTGFPLLFFIYESLLKGETVLTVERDMPANANFIARILDVAVVTFGHTHIPRQFPLEAGVSFVDTGTWAPITKSTEDRCLAKGYRNYLICTFEEDHHCLQFDCWPIPRAQGASKAQYTAQEKC